MLIEADLRDEGGELADAGGLTAILCDQSTLEEELVLASYRQDDDPLPARAWELLPAGRGDEPAYGPARQPGDGGVARRARASSRTSSSSPPRRSPRGLTRSSSPTSATRSSSSSTRGRPGARRHTGPAGCSPPARRRSPGSSSSRVGRSAGGRSGTGAGSRSWSSATRARTTSPDIRRRPARDPGGWRHGGSGARRVVGRSRPCHQPAGLVRIAAVRRDARAAGGVRERRGRHGGGPGRVAAGGLGDARRPAW